MLANDTVPEQPVFYQSRLTPKEYETAASVPRWRLALRLRRTSPEVVLGRGRAQRNLISSRMVILRRLSNFSAPLASVTLLHSAGHPNQFRNNSITSPSILTIDYRE